MIGSLCMHSDGHPILWISNADLFLSSIIKRVTRHPLILSQLSDVRANETSMLPYHQFPLLYEKFKVSWF